MYNNAHTRLPTDEALTPGEACQAGEQPESCRVEVWEWQTGKFEYFTKVESVGPPQLQHQHHLLPQFLQPRERQVRGMYNGTSSYKTPQFMSNLRCELSQFFVLTCEQKLKLWASSNTPLLFGTATPSILNIQLTFLAFFCCGCNSHIVLAFCEFCAVEWLIFFGLTISSEEVALSIMTYA